MKVPWDLDPKIRDREARLLGLRKFARVVFVRRNAQGWNEPGMPKGDRLALKTEARPYFRQAIHWARKSRDALLAGAKATRDHTLLDRRGASRSIFADAAEELDARLTRPTAKRTA